MLILSRTLMTAMEIGMMTGMEILIYQTASDQSILIKQLQLKQHSILPQTTTQTWIKETTM